MMADMKREGRDIFDEELDLNQQSHNHHEN
jgi:hypothetical protein